MAENKLRSPKKMRSSTDGQPLPLLLKPYGELRQDLEQVGPKHLFQFRMDTIREI